MLNAWLFARYKFSSYYYYYIISRTKWETVKIGCLTLLLSRDLQERQHQLDISVPLSLVGLLFTVQQRMHTHGMAVAFLVCQTRAL